MSSLLTSNLTLMAGLLTLSACAGGSQQVRTARAEVVTVWAEYANVHVLKSPKGWVLIDSGYEAHAPEIAERMVDEGLDPTKIAAVIVTHGHADHAGGAGYFQNTFGAKIIAGRGDAAMIKAGRMENLCPTGWMAEQRLEEDLASTYAGFAPDVWVDADQSLAELVGIEGQVMMMPGHTEGSLVVVSGDAAFVGDLFRGGIVGSGVETHFYMCDLADNRRDIRALLDAHPSVQTFFTGHLGPVDRDAVEDYLQD